MRGLSLVATTNQVDRMQDATSLLTQTGIVAPGLDRALLLNQRHGTFSFPAGSAECDAFEALERAAKGLPVLRLPSVRGESWQACENAGLTMRETIELDLTELVRRLRGNPYVIAAIQSQVAAWWTIAEKEVLGILEAKDGEATDIA